MKKFDTIYKKTSTGKIQTWSVTVFGNFYRTHSGQEGGKITDSEPTYCTGKQGRTDQEQAMAEAQSLFDKKLKSSGYVRTKEAAAANEVDDKVLGGCWPMLAAKYRDRASKISWPAAAQRKLNGHRCIATVDASGKCSLWSRKRNQIKSMPHIVAAIEDLKYADIVLDGELFDAEFVEKNGLEALSHLVRSGGPVAGHEVIRYHVFDMPSQKGTFRQRWSRARDVLAGAKDPLVLEETVEIADDEAALAWLEERMDEDGAEGIMLRNWSGLYKFHPNGRSDDLQKLKGVGNKYDDAEFKVVGVKQGKKGKMVGKAIFECVTDAGVPFDAKMKGDLGKLKEYWEHPERAIGRVLTVQFIGFSKKGKPWFPVALQFREDA